MKLYKHIICFYIRDDRERSFDLRSFLLQNNDAAALEMQRRRLESLTTDSETAPITVPIKETGNNELKSGYIVAVHRKSVRQDTYFLSQHKSRPALFGVPLLLARHKNTTCQQLYEAVWKQVTRLLSPPPPAGHQVSDLLILNQYGCLSKQHNLIILTVTI